MTLLNVGFTGTRQLLTEAQYHALWAVLVYLDPACCHHGDCVGADSYFHDLVVALDRNLIIHPPEDPIFRAYCSTGHRIMYPTATYLERNRNIVDESDQMIACPNSFHEEKRSGTWSTVRYARRLGRIIYVVFPDGSVRQEGP